MSTTTARLPSWRQGPARDAITAFLDEVRTVPARHRTAVLDHDGTLRCERPTFLLYDFLVAEVRNAVATQPGAAERADFQLMLRGDPDEIARFGMRRCIAAAYELAAGITPEQFTQRVRDFVLGADGAGAGGGGVDYRQLIYRPMLELIDALRAAEFTVFINARYSVELVRSFSLDYYGVPPECVIGTPIDYQFVRRDGVPELLRTPEIIGEISSGAANVVHIQTQAGRRPIFAAGNSFADQEFLDYTASSAGPSLALFISHDDPEREYAYQPQADVRREGWTVVSMRDDWATVFDTAAA